MRKMKQEEIEKILKKQNWATICSVDKECNPYAIEATYFIKEDGSINFMINPKGTTMTNIKLNNNVLLKISRASASLSEWFGISCFGKAFNILDKKEIEEGWNLLGKVMKQDYKAAKEKFAKPSSLSPLLSVKVERISGVHS